MLVLGYLFLDLSLEMVLSYLLDPSYPFEILGAHTLAVNKISTIFKFEIFGAYLTLDVYIFILENIISRDNGFNIPIE